MSWRLPKNWATRNVAFANKSAKLRNTALFGGEVDPAPLVAAPERCPPLTTNQRARIRRILKRRQPFICCWCRCDLSDATATIEHIIRRADGGTNDLSNLALACRHCNNNRHGRSWTPRAPLLPAPENIYDPPAPAPFNHKCYGPMGIHWMRRMNDGNGTPYCHWCQKHRDAEIMAAKEKEREKFRPAHSPLK